uniref:Uncharacterized protein n=1 Tax=Musa acuminata subsp. malaccensis TaxID=214687 RepID=A0A804JY33_MUSAM
MKTSFNIKQFQSPLTLNNSIKSTVPGISMNPILVITHDILF